MIPWPAASSQSRFKFSAPPQLYRSSVAHHRRPAHQLPLTCLEHDQCVDSSPAGSGGTNPSVSHLTMRGDRKAEIRRIPHPLQILQLSIRDHCASQCYVIMVIMVTMVIITASQLFFLTHLEGWRVLEEFGSHQNPSKPIQEEFDLTNGKAHGHIKPAFFLFRMKFWELQYMRCDQEKRNPKNGMKNAYLVVAHDSWRKLIGRISI